MSARITDRVFEPDDDASGQNEVPYLLKDLYTVAGLADERGWPVERYDYDAYGKVHMERVAILPWAADFDGDGDVDQNDLTVFLDAYGGSGQASNGPRGWRADLDGDGDVDGSDYLLVADAYNGAENPPRPPVGSMAITTGSMVVSRVGNPYFFTGRRLDVIDKHDAGTPHHFTDDYAGLQLYDFRARTDEPVMGRFNQRDPSGYVDGMGLYQYAKGLPFRVVDPYGLCVEGEQKHSVSTVLTPGHNPDDTKFIITIFTFVELYDCWKNPGAPCPLNCVVDSPIPDGGEATQVFCHFLKVLKESGRLQVWTKVKCKTCVARRIWWCLWLKKRTRWEEEDRGWQACDVRLSDVVQVYPGSTYGLSKENVVRLVSECEKKASEGADCGTKE